MTNTFRYDRHILNRVATDAAHPFQKEVVKRLLAHGWDLQSVIPARTYGKVVTVVTLTPNSLFAGVAPNGLVFSPAKGKTNIEGGWNRMADLVDLADATVPVNHVVFQRAA